MKIKNKSILIILILISLLSQSTTAIAQEQQKAKSPISTESYNLYQPDQTEAVLILFGGFTENGEMIENEFPITEMALKKNVAVVYMNINRKILLEESEKEDVATILKNLFKSNKLPKEKIVIGGLSSGGNLALLMSSYLTQNPNFSIKPTAVLVVDSPIDLAALYRITEENIENNFSEAAVGESRFINNYFKTKLGDPGQDIKLYEKYSVYTFETSYFQNIKNLKNTKLRFYAEPDKEWWKENMGVEYEQMNAFHIKRLTEFLKNKDYKDVEYITTENKGYRFNGVRHPHSWSIVDKEDLLEWVVEE